MFEIQENSSGPQKSHDVKSWPRFFEMILQGRKPFEYRRDDRGYQEGDELVLWEYDPASGVLSGRRITATIDLIFRDVPGMPEGYVLMGLRNIT